MKSSPPAARGTPYTLAAAVAAALAALAAPAAAEANADSEELESIIVTAQSRTQAESDVPIAMQVVTAQQILDLGAANLADFNGYIPGLSVDGSQPTQPFFGVRGIGTGDFGIGTDAPVGVYVDGIYTGKTGGSLLNFDDVQRVEVLKGPQGTLFGRNSAAGAISIITNEPEQATDADALLRYGRWDTVEFHGMVNVPVADDMAMRLSVVSKNSSGWITDVTTGEKFGGEDTWGTRLSYKWTPSSDSKLIASWEHEGLDQPARFVYSLVPVAPNASTPPPVPPNPASFINPLNSPLENDAPNRETRSFDGVTLRYQKDFQGLQLSSNTAYRHFDSYNGESNDGTSSILTYLSTINAEGNTTFQQDFKLAAKNEHFDWIAGLSYYHMNASQVSTVDTTTNSIDTLWLHSPGLLAQTGGEPLFVAVDAELGNPASGLGLGNSWQEVMANSNHTNSYSLYGDAIWHLGASTDLTTGIRLTRDSKDVSWFVPPYSAPALDAQFIAATGQTFGQVSGIRNIVFQNQASIAAQPVSAERSWGDVSPRLVLDHKFDARTMVYAAVARGFQSGGYDVFNPLAGFEPEHMVNYEAGVKSTLPELHAYVEASVFHYRFSNLQNITLVSVTNSLPEYDVTTSDQSASGVDLSGRAEVVKGFSLFGAAEYIRQKYDNYSFTDNITGQLDSLNGQPVGTPLLTLALGERTTWPMARGTGEFVLQGNYQSPQRCNLQIIQSFGCLDTPVVQTGTAQTKVDARLGWRADHFGAALLVNNVLNKQYVSGSAGETGYTLGTPNASITAPRYVGVEVSANL